MKIFEMVIIIMKIFKKVIIILILLILLLVLTADVIHVVSYEGLDGFIGKLFWPEHDTVYAKNYNEKKFRMIKIGDSEDRVISLIGDPFYVKQIEENCIGWYYSKSPSYSNYHKRNIYFSSEGKVVEILHEYYTE